MHLRGAGVSQLGFLPKVPTAGQKRLERIGDRFDRLGTRRKARGDNDR
jgi:hypothetical protein